jgi:hypothetical protein
MDGVVKLSSDVLIAVVLPWVHSNTKTKIRKCHFKIDKRKSPYTNVNPISSNFLIKLYQNFTYHPIPIKTVISIIRAVHPIHISYVHI